MGGGEAGEGLVEDAPQLEAYQRAAGDDRHAARALHLRQMPANQADDVLRLDRAAGNVDDEDIACLLYTSPSPRDS